MEASLDLLDDGRLADDESDRPPAPSPPARLGILAAVLLVFAWSALGGVLVAPGNDQNNAPEQATLATTVTQLVLAHALALIGLLLLGARRPARVAFGGLAVWLLFGGGCGLPLFGFGMWAVFSRATTEWFDAHEDWRMARPRRRHWKWWAVGAACWALVLAFRFGAPEHPFWAGTSLPVYAHPESIERLYPEQLAYLRGWSGLDCEATAAAIDEAKGTGELERLFGGGDFIAVDMLREGDCCSRRVCAAWWSGGRTGGSWTLKARAPKYGNPSSTLMTGTDERIRFEDVVELADGSRVGFEVELRAAALAARFED